MASPASRTSRTASDPVRLPTTDQVRRIVVVLAELFCVFGTLVGVGVLGTRVAESSGGALAADATLIAPAGPAFSIWSVIYLGLAAYTIWQLFPRNAASPRTRATGWLAAVSMVLNAVWLLVTQQGWIWISVVVILALAIVLGLIMRQLTQYAAGGRMEQLVVDGTFGLYLGWVTVATCANVTAAAEVSGAGWPGRRRSSPHSASSRWRRRSGLCWPSSSAGAGRSRSPRPGGSPGSPSAVSPMSRGRSWLRSVQWWRRWLFFSPPPGDGPGTDGPGASLPGSGNFLTAGGETA